MTVQSKAIAPAVARIPAPFWLFPVGAAIGCVFFLLTSEEGGLVQQAFIGAMWGAFGAVPAVMVAGFASILLLTRRERALWQTQGVEWYRSHFPELAQADGELGCRFCGGMQAYPHNIAGHADVRAYRCGRCGETLFYVNGAE